jgi:signal peptidase II
VALGLFSGNNALLGVLSLVIVAALSVLAFRIGAGGRLGAIALGLLAGGAISNLIDRVRLGAVTDFIEVRAWPTDFNLGDAAVRLGVLLFLLSLLVTARRRSRPAG